MLGLGDGPVGPALSKGDDVDAVVVGRCPGEPCLFRVCGQVECGAGPAAGGGKSDPGRIPVAGTDGDIEAEGPTRGLLGVGRDRADHSVRHGGQSFVDVFPPMHAWSTFALQGDQVAPSTPGTGAERAANGETATEAAHVGQGERRATAGSG